MLPHRREVLQALGLTAAGATLDFGLADTIHNHFQEQSAEPKKTGPFRPQFYRAQETATVARLTDLILPSDGTPGAKDAGVTEFLDFYLANSPEAAQAAFHQGLEWIEATSRAKFGQPLVGLSESKQIALLTLISSPGNTDPGDLTGVRFFQTLRTLTIFAFYTSKIGIQELGYIGNTFTAEFPGACTHQHEL